MKNRNAVTEHSNHLILRVFKEMRDIAENFDLDILMLRAGITPDNESLNDLCSEFSYELYRLKACALDMYEAINMNKEGEKHDN